MYSEVATDCQFVSASVAEDRPSARTRCSASSAWSSAPICSGQGWASLSASCALCCRKPRLSAFSPIAVATSPWISGGRDATRGVPSCAAHNDGACRCKMRGTGPWLAGPGIIDVGPDANGVDNSQRHHGATEPAVP